MKHDGPAAQDGRRGNGAGGHEGQGRHEAHAEAGARHEEVRGTLQPAVGLVKALGSAPIAQLPSAVRLASEGVDAAGRGIDGLLCQHLARRVEEPHAGPGDHAQPRLPSAPAARRVASSTVAHAKIGGGAKADAGAESGAAAAGGRTDRAQADGADMVSERVSAGPREPVPLVGAAAPAHVDAAHQAGHRTVEDALHNANRATLHAPDIATLRQRTREEVPAPPPLRPITGAPVPRHDAIEIVPEKAPQAQAMIGPRLAEMAVAGAAQAQAAADRAQTQVTALHQQHDEGARQAAQQQTVARARGQQHADSLRGQWQQANAQLHAQHQEHVETRRGQVMEKAQQTLQTGEHEADGVLTRTESEASQHLAASAVRAAAARAASHKRPIQRQANGGHGATENDGGGASSDGDGGAAKILADAQALVDQMLAAAHAHNTANVKKIQAQIAALLAAHQQELHDAITTALAKFPRIAAYYNEQLDALFKLTQSDVDAIGTLQQQHNRMALDETMDALAHDLTQLKGSFAEIATMADKNYTLADLQAAFGIDFSEKNLPEGAKSEWTDTTKELALLGAISTEHAFRRSAYDGQMDKVGFGQGFQSIFGNVDMVYDTTHKHNGSDKEYGADTTVDKDGRNPTITFYPYAFTVLRPDHDIGEEEFLYNVIHEFGHAFDNAAHRTGRGDLSAETIYAQVKGKNGLAPIAGKETHGRRYYDDADYGMRNDPRGVYQQDTDSSPSEEFADMFANWVENSFADNDAGRARFNWMDRHMWGDTSGGAEQEKQWGWADIAIDNNSGSSKWIGQYTVVSGDTVATVAKKMGVKPEDLARLNNITVDTPLTPTSRLLVPGLTQAQVDAKNA